VIYQGTSGEYLQLEKVSKANEHAIIEKLKDGLSIVWFSAPGNIFKIDGVTHEFNVNEVIALTEFHQIEIINITSFNLVRFNRSFYCVVSQDSEVGCKGILFFGTQATPKFSIPEFEVEKFSTLWKMFRIEMESPDALQQEMLQMMLKRLLILCTRLYKECCNLHYLDTNNSDLIRSFNYLVETHFHKLHAVADYADLLNKSPKTLSNVFAKEGFDSPLTFIHNRIYLEAKRLLGYSNYTVKEIAYQLGFEDLQSFSRFFKRQEGQSPSDFKSSL
jgi:AraC-like DNA-binding protein